MARTPRKIPEILIEGDPPRQGRLAWAAETILKRIVGFWFNAIANPLRDVIAFALEQFFDLLEEPLLAWASPYLDDLIDNPNIPPKIRNMLSQAKRGDSAIDLAIIGTLLVPLLVSAIAAAFTPINKLVAMQVERLVQTERPDPGATYAMLWRQQISPERVTGIFDETGWSPDFEHAWEEIVRPRTGVAELGMSMLRGNIGVGAFRSELQKRGYSGEDVAIIEKLLQRIPGPGDLVSMAVREAWRDDVAAKFGYDADFPPEFGDWMEKQGMSTDWAKRYWRAHWRLPGLTQALEMFQRKIITPGELDDYLRAADIPNFWRKAITQMGYRVITRVDARRMYQSGVYNEQEVYRAYTDLGYSDKDATDLTIWTISEYTQETRELTKSDILGLYRDGVINREELVNLLEALAYSGMEIDLLIARIELKKIEEYEKEIVKNIRLSFVGRIVDENYVYQELGKLNPPAGFIEERLAVWRIQRRRAVRKPTIAQLRDFWLSGVISLDILREQLVAHGFQDTYIDWYITLWKGGFKE